MLIDVEESRASPPGCTGEDARASTGQRSQL